MCLICGSRRKNMITPNVDKEIVFNHVYYVERAENGPPFNPIAIRPRIYVDRIEWEDTSNGARISFKEIEVGQDQKKIKIISKEGYVVILSILTLALFDEKVRHRVAGNLQVKTDKELSDYYLNTNFYIY